MCVCLSVDMSERVGVAHTNSRRLSTSARNIYSSIISYFAISSTFERFGVCVSVCVCVSLPKSSLFAATATAAA